MRTRSAKNAANAKIQQALAESDEDMASDTYDAQDQSEEEEESTLGKSARARRKSASGSGPPAKKAKISASSAQTLSVATKPSRRKSLSVLVTMPLDILFEVFGHLAPKDLVSLSSTTKTLRGTLLDKSAKSIWISSRASVGAPDPPEDLSEVQWAALLFGHHCMGCKTTNIHTIDFLIRRRVCTSCKKKNLIVRNRVKKVFEGIDETVLDYISATNVGGWAHGHASSSEFYWKSDIEKMLLTLAKYEADVRSRKKGAKQALEDFKAQRIKTVEMIRAGAAKYKDWVSTAARERHNDTQEAQKKRKEEIERRFMELGYARVDVSGLGWRFYDEYKKKGQITDRVWTRVRAEMEPAVAEAYRSRREREDSTVRCSRRAILDRLFKAYKMTVPPSQWKYLPTTAILSGLQPFRDIVEGAASTTVTEADFTPHIANIQDILSAAKSELKTRLIDRAIAELQTVPDFAPILNRERDQLLELATIAFDCNINRGRYATALFGWDEITSHFCSDGGIGLPNEGLSYLRGDTIYDTEYPYKIVCLKNRCKAAKAVVEAADLDPVSATVTDMDTKDLRFRCVTCDAMSDRFSWDWHGRGKDAAYTWRACVEHVYARHNSDPEGHIEVLPPITITCVKAQERIENRGSALQWACTHCDAHLTTPTKFNLVNEHVKQAHKIADPVDNVDLIYLPRSRQDHLIKYPTAIQQHSKSLGLGSSKQIEAGTSSGASAPKPRFRWPTKCLQCASSQSFHERDRLFDIEGVKAHLKAKHKKSEPVKDVDYMVFAKADIPQSWVDKFQPAPEDVTPPS